MRDAPQEAPTTTQQEVLYSEQDNNAEIIQQDPAGSSPSSTAYGLPTAQEGEETDYQSEDDVPEADQERFEQGNIEAFPQAVDEYIDDYDNPSTNYHQRSGRRVSRRMEERNRASAIRAYKISLKKPSSLINRVSKTL